MEKDNLKEMQRMLSLDPGSKEMQELVDSMLDGRVTLHCDLDDYTPSMDNVEFADPE